MLIQIYVEGTALGNPGRAGAGAVICHPDGSKDTYTRYLGSTTSHVAGWLALILALQSVPKAATVLDVYLGNELVVKQARGEEPVKRQVLTYYEQVLGLLAILPACTIHYLATEENGLAVAASLQAIGARSKKKAPQEPAAPQAPPRLQPTALFPELVPGPIFQPSSESVRKFVLKAERKLAVKDYLALRSGRDAFSGLRLQDLVKQVPDEAVEELGRVFGRPDDQAKACRWVLRGLSVEQSIQKVKIDQDLGLSANKNRVRSSGGSA